MWRRRVCVVGAAIALVGASAACRNPFGRQYEYQEEMYLGVDGSAQIELDSSIAALAALHGMPLDPDVAVDRGKVRALFAAAGCGEVRVISPWTRFGRRFVGVRWTVADVRQLSACGPLRWSSYEFERDGQEIHYTQTVGPPEGSVAMHTNWTGSEIVAFRLHLPSKILWHNVKRLEDGQNGTYERGNILTWEQWLKDRRAGTPVQIQVRIGAESILYRTLSLFLGAFAAAVILLVTLIWITVRRAKRRARAA
jgi:hypothetical protein